jgi:hypothetical protein
MTIRTMNQTQGCAANALLPGTSFAFLPANMVSQILNFRVPAPIDLQVIGNDLQANRKYANDLLSRIKQIPGISDARIQQAFQQPTLNVAIPHFVQRHVEQAQHSGLHRFGVVTLVLVPRRPSRRGTWTSVTCNGMRTYCRPSRRRLRWRRMRSAAVARRAHFP